LRRGYKSKGSRKPLRQNKLKSKSLRRAVKLMVRRQLETKENQETPSAKNIQNYINETNVFSLLPIISQGTGQSGRIGNKISPTYFTVKVAIICANMNLIYTGASSTYFDIYIFKWKGSNQEGGAPTSTDMGRFLQNDNSASSYEGLILDGLRPVNSDMFTLIKKKRVCLNNISVTSVATMSGAYQSTQPQRTLSFNLTKYIKKTLLYDDSATSIINDNMYIAIGATQCDGQSTVGYASGSYSFFTNMKFKDA